MAIGDICIISADLIRAVNKAKVIDHGLARKEFARQRRSSLSMTAANSSVEDSYRGPFAIVRQPDGTYAVGDNSGAELAASAVRVNGSNYSVPVTPVFAGNAVWLQIDLTGESPAFSFVNSESNAENIYSVEIGRIAGDGTITQVYADGVFDLFTPVVIDDTLSALLTVKDNKLTLSEIGDYPVQVPIISSGKIVLVPAQELPWETYDA